MSNLEAEIKSKKDELSTMKKELAYTVEKEMYFGVIENAKRILEIHKELVTLYDQRKK